MLKLVHSRAGLQASAPLSVHVCDLELMSKTRTHRNVFLELYLPGRACADLLSEAMTLSNEATKMIRRNCLNCLQKRGFGLWGPSLRARFRIWAGRQVWVHGLRSTGALYTAVFHIVFVPDSVL